MWNYKKFPATICGVIAMLSGSQVQAQEPQVSIEKQGAVEELRGIVDSALTAARLHNEAKLKEVAHAMMIPDPTTWFVATFGEEQGMKMASAYEANLDREENTLPWLFQRLTKRKGEMLIQNAATTKSLGASPCAQALLKSAKRESSFYRVGLEWNNGPNVTGFSSLGYFTLVDGTYRLLDFFMGSPYLEWKVVCKLPKSFIQYNRSTPTKPREIGFQAKYAYTFSWQKTEPLRKSRLSPVIRCFKMRPLKR